MLQLATLEAEFDRRDRAGLVKWGENGLPEDHDSRRLKGNINNLQKVLLHDERESDMLVAREDAFLRQAIANYGRCADMPCMQSMTWISFWGQGIQQEQPGPPAGLHHHHWKQCLCCLLRCLVADSAHDLEVVFRLVQLWLSLGAEASAVRQLRSAFKATPSHKFLPLMYQMASRLSAATTGPLVSSGFQASTASAQLSYVVRVYMRRLCVGPQHRHLMACRHL